MDLAGLPNKSITEMTDEELLELIGETRNNRLENVNKRRNKKKSEAKAKVKKVKPKKMTLSEVLAKVDSLSPEEAGRILTKIQSGQTVTTADFESNGTGVPDITVEDD